jgi:hypothetical protein
MRRERRHVGDPETANSLTLPAFGQLIIGERRLHKFIFGVTGSRGKSAAWASGMSAEEGPAPLAQRPE